MEKSSGTGETEHPYLVDSTKLNRSDFGLLKWNSNHNQDLLKFSCYGRYDIPQHVLLNHKLNASQYSYLCNS